MDPLSTLERHFWLWSESTLVADVVGSHYRLLLRGILLLSVRLFWSGQSEMVGDLVFQFDEVYHFGTPHHDSWDSKCLCSDVGDGRSDYGISDVWRVDFNPCEQICPPRLINLWRLSSLFSPRKSLAPLAWLEHAAHGLGIRCSVHLSYRGFEIKFRTFFSFRQD